MSSSFWSNTIWYILLFVSSIITIILTLIKSKNRKLTIGFTLATLGFVYSIEVILALLFKSYMYYPKITNDIFQDTVLGNVFSQVSISSTSALTIVFELSYKWYFLFALIYYSIEELFLKLGIYQHHWYKSIYTLIGFVPLFWIIKKWYYKLMSSSKQPIYYITLFLGTSAISANTIIMPLKLLQIQIFKANFFAELSKNHTTVAIIYGFILINILIILYKSKLHWVWKVITFILLFMTQFALYKSNVIYVKYGWFFIVTLIDIFGIYFWIAVLDHLLRKKSSSQPKTFLH